MDLLGSIMDIYQESLNDAIFEEINCSVFTEHSTRRLFMKTIHFLDYFTLYINVNLKNELVS